MLLCTSNTSLVIKKQWWLNGFTYCRELKSGVVPLSSLEFVCKITFEIYHNHFGEGKHCKKNCTHLFVFNDMCEVPNPHWACVGTGAQAVSLCEGAYAQQ